ncbi:PulJ/GspJ family protein [Paludisphaera mucosa]|uniref:Prepilin-type N-terminal cleavage/methylation domain-containing protein n=1 Tax=Paludisphaera mucosa TaxID=3030827 RepID=A0ABT6F9E9_9BACT|nr:hypothetical protein [Paludisphaera mucosa]MDG3004018.1 hypothetical protein [Paludisphaera mucosa]
MSTPANRRSQSRRRGVTLVELMVLLTAVALMLGTCVMLLGLAMRLEADGRAAFERSEALDRLAGRFRADVHEARGVALDGRTLKLQPRPGRAVEYRVADDGAVSRVVVEGGKDAAREPYRIPQAVAARLEIREIEGRRFAAIVVDVQPRKDRIDPVRPVEILALAGKGAPAGKPEGGKP